jgi:signal transduction histidine kinase
MPLRARRVIERQTAHLMRLVDDLLDVTRISRGMINLQRERLDLNDLARRATDDHRALFARAGVELRLQLADGSLCIEADRTRLTQIIGNLLQNAAKFTGQGGTTTVAVEREEPAGLALIRVRDTGAGISADMVPRLFNPFTQADRTLDRSRGGLGLGLALVKGLVELHHGTVEASSAGVGRARSSRCGSRSSGAPSKTCRRPQPRWSRARACRGSSSLRTTRTPLRA